MRCPLGNCPAQGGGPMGGVMVPVRLLIAAAVLIFFQPALAEQPAGPAQNTTAEQPVPAQPPALEISSPYEDAERHLVRTFESKTSAKFAAFLPDGHSAILAGIGGITVLDLASGQEVRHFPGDGPKDPLIAMSAALSRDGRFILAGRFRRFELWDISSASKVRAFEGYAGSVSAVAFSPDGHRALAGGDYGRLVLWDLETGKPVHKLIADGDSGVITKEDLQKPMPLKTLRKGSGLMGKIGGVAILPDGRTGLAGGAMNAPLQLWDLKTGKVAVRLEGNKIGSVTLGPFVSVLAISPDGRKAITGGSDKMVYFWDLKTGKQLRKLSCGRDFVGAVAFSPDGRFAVSGATPMFLGQKGADSGGDIIKLWSVSTGKELHQFGGGLKSIGALAFSPDGRFILSSGSGDKDRLWDASEWTQQAAK
jgi:WD40 repeat protein